MSVVIYDYSRDVGVLLFLTLFGKFLTWWVWADILMVNVMFLFLPLIFADRLVGGHLSLCEGPLRQWGFPGSPRSPWQRCWRSTSCETQRDRKEAVLVLLYLVIRIVYPAGNALLYILLNLCQFQVELKKREKKKDLFLHRAHTQRTTCQGRRNNMQIHGENQSSPQRDGLSHTHWQAHTHTHTLLLLCSFWKQVAVKVFSNRVNYASVCHCFHPNWKLPFGRDLCYFSCPMSYICILLTVMVCVSTVWYTLVLCTIELYYCPKTIKNTLHNPI